MTWSPAHWLVGLLTLLILPLTGQYMRYIVGVPHLDSVPRLIFRSRHLFFFWWLGWPTLHRPTVNLCTAGSA